MDEKTNGYVLYAMRLIDLLLHYNVKPILVFDGRNLPSKARTEAKRRENRANYRKMVSCFRIWPYTSCSEIFSGYTCKKELDVLNFCLYQL